MSVHRLHHIYLLTGKASYAVNVFGVLLRRSFQGSLDVLFIRIGARFMNSLYHIQMQPAYISYYKKGNAI